MPRHAGRFLRPSGLQHRPRPDGNTQTHLKLADISIDDHELIDSLTPEKVKELLIEIYNDSPDDLYKHCEIGIKIMMGSDAIIPAPFWWLDEKPKKKDRVQ